MCPKMGNVKTYRTAKGAQFPIEDTNHTILRWVEDHVVQLVVSVNDPGTGLRLVWKVLGVPLHEVVESGYLSDDFLTLNIHSLGLRERNPCQGFYLAREIGVR